MGTFTIAPQACVCPASLDALIAEAATRAMTAMRGTICTAAAREIQLTSACPAIVRAIRARTILTAIGAQRGISLWGAVATRALGTVHSAAAADRAMCAVKDFIYGLMGRAVLVWQIVWSAILISTACSAERGTTVMMKGNAWLVAMDAICACMEMNVWTAMMDTS